MISDQQREADRAELARILEAREQARADAEAGAEWARRGIAAMEPEPVSDPRLVHMMPAHPDDMRNPLETARQIRAAQERERQDPWMRAYAEERKVPSQPFGQGSYNDRNPHGNRRA